MIVHSRFESHDDRQKIVSRSSECSLMWSIAVCLAAALYLIFRVPSADFLLTSPDQGYQMALGMAVAKDRHPGFDFVAPYGPDVTPNWAAVVLDMQNWMNAGLSRRSGCHAEPPISSIPKVREHRFNGQAPIWSGRIPDIYARLLRPRSSLRKPGRQACPSDPS